MSKMHRIIVSWWALCLVSDVLHNLDESVPLPSILFNFTDILENVRFSAAVDTFANLPTSPNVSHHSLC